jgi:hypothetical protein
MRSYLAKFQNAPLQAGISVEKVLSEEPSKPSKPGFAGFDGLLPSTFPLVLPALATLPIEDASNVKALPDQPSKPSKPSFDGFDGASPKGFQTEISTQPQPGTCPTCHDAADLQDRQLDVWWCSRCRTFLDGAGKPIPPATPPRPLTAEQEEAEKLAADLLEAGCGFSDDTEYFGVRMPKKISAGLLARLETTDWKELRRAAAKLTAEMEGSEGWVN